VITTITLGRPPVGASRASFSYKHSASRRMLKSSSGVQDVLDTKRAGRSERSVGMLGRVYVDVYPENVAVEEVGLISVKGVE
jgi:ribosome recycling factor